jgi:alpha-tubulin suppressor-like RCC1 family protein
MNLILIDSLIPDVTQFSNACNENTKYIIYNQSDTFDGLLARINDIGIYQYDYLAFAFASDNTKLKQFISYNTFISFFIDVSLNETIVIQPNNTTQFIKTLVDDYGIKTVDFLACNLLNNDIWKQYFEYIKSQSSASGIQVRASNNKTGNLNHGGDWILETTNEDIKSLYFNDTIDYWNYLLDFTATFTAITTTEPINNLYSTISNTFKSFKILGYSYSKTHSLIFSNDLSNNLYSCGYNTNGQLGNNNTTNSLVDYINVVNLSASPNLLGKQIISVANGDKYSFVLSNESTNNVYCCGLNTLNQISYTSNQQQFVKLPLSTYGTAINNKKVIGIACGTSHTMLITSEATNNLYGCGDNKFGQLGTGNIDNTGLIITNISLLSTTLINKTIIKVQCGDSHTAVITNQATNNLYACGNNSSGQIGNTLKQDIVFNDNWTTYTTPTATGGTISGISTNSLPVTLTSTLCQVTLLNRPNVNGSYQYMHLKYKVLVGAPTSITIWYGRASFTASLNAPTTNFDTTTINVWKYLSIYVGASNQWTGGTLWTRFRFNIVGKANDSIIFENFIISKNQNYEFENIITAPLSGKKIIDIACGTSHTVVLTSDSVNNLYGCGSNTNSQLGDSSITESLIYKNLSTVGTILLTKKVNGIMCDDLSTIVYTSETINNCYVCGTTTLDYVGSSITTSTTDIIKTSFQQKIVNNKSITKYYTNNVAPTASTFTNFVFPTDGVTCYLNYLNYSTNTITFTSNGTNTYGILYVKSYFSLSPIDTYFTKHIQFDVNIGLLSSIPYKALLVVYNKTAADSTPVSVPSSNTSLNDVYYSFNSITGLITINTKLLSDMLICQYPIDPTINGITSDYNFNYGINNYVTNFINQTNKDANQITMTKVTPATPNKYSLNNVINYNTLTPANVTFNTYITFNLLADVSYNSNFSLYSVSNNVVNVIPPTNSAAANSPFYYSYNTTTKIVTISTKYCLEYLTVQTPINPTISTTFNGYSFIYGTDNITFFQTPADKLSDKIQMTSFTPSDANVLYNLTNVTTYNRLEPETTLFKNHVQFNLLADVSYNSNFRYYYVSNGSSIATLVPSTNTSSNQMYYSYNSITKSATIYTRLFSKILTVQEPIDPSINFTGYNFNYGTNNYTFFQDETSKTNNSITMTNNVIPTTKYTLTNITTYNSLNPLNTLFKNHVNFDLSVNDVSYNANFRYYYVTNGSSIATLVPSTNTSANQMYYDYTPITKKVTIYTRLFSEILTVQEPIDPSINGFSGYNFNYGTNNITFFQDTTSKTNNNIKMTSLTLSNVYNLTNVITYNRLEPVTTLFKNHVNFDLVSDVSYNANFKYYYVSNGSSIATLVPSTNTISNQMYYSYNSNTKTSTIYTKLFSDILTVQEPIEPSINFTGYNFNYGTNNITFFQDTTSKTNNSITMTNNVIPTTKYTLTNIMTYNSLTPLKTLFKNHVNFDLSVNDVSYNSTFRYYYVSDGSSIATLVPSTNTSANQMYYSYSSITKSVTIYTRLFSEILTVQEPIDPSMSFTGYNFNYGTNNITFFQDTTSRTNNKITMTKLTPSDASSGLTNVVTYHRMEPVSTLFKSRVNFDLVSDVSYNATFKCYFISNNIATLVSSSDTSSNQPYYSYNSNTKTATIYTKLFSEIQTVQEPIDPIPIGFNDYNFSYGTNNITFFQDSTNKTKNNISMTKLSPVDAYSLINAVTYNRLEPVTTLFKTHIKFDLSVDVSYNANTLEVYYVLPNQNVTLIPSSNDANNNIYYSYNLITKTVTVFTTFLCEIITAQVPMNPIFINMTNNTLTYGLNNASIFPDEVYKTSNQLVFNEQTHEDSYSSDGLDYITKTCYFEPKNTIFRNHIQYDINIKRKSFASIVNLYITDASLSPILIPSSNDLTNEIYYTYNNAHSILTLFTKRLVDLIITQEPIVPTFLKFINLNYGNSNIAYFPTNETIQSNTITINESSSTIDYHLQNTRNHYIIEPLNIHFLKHISFELPTDLLLNGGISNLVVNLYYKTDNDAIPQLVSELDNETKLVYYTIDKTSGNVIVHTKQSADFFIVQTYVTPIIIQYDSMNVNYGVNNITYYPDLTTKEEGTLKMLSYYVSNTYGLKNIISYYKFEPQNATFLKHISFISNSDSTINSTINLYTKRETDEEPLLVSADNTSDDNVYYSVNQQNGIITIYTKVCLDIYVIQLPNSPNSPINFTNFNYGIGNITYYDNYESKETNTIQLVNHDLSYNGMQYIKSYHTLEPLNTTFLNHIKYDIGIDTSYNSTIYIYSKTIQDASLILIPKTNNIINQTYYTLNLTTGVITLNTKLLTEMLIIQEPLIPTMYGFTNLIYGDGNVTYFNSTKTKKANTIKNSSITSLNSSNINTYGLQNITTYNVIEPAGALFLKHIQFDISNIGLTTYLSTLSIYIKTPDISTPLLLTTHDASNNTYYTYNSTTESVTIYTKCIGNIVAIQTPIEPVSIGFENYNYKYNTNNKTYFSTEMDKTNNTIELTTSSLRNSSLPHIKSHIKLIPYNTTFSNHIQFDTHIDISYNSIVNVYYISNITDEPVLIPLSNTSTNEMYYVVQYGLGIVTIYTKQLYEIVVTQSPVQPNYVDVSKPSDQLVYYYGNDNITVFPDSTSKQLNKVSISPLQITANDKYSTMYYEMKPNATRFLNNIRVDMIVDTTYNYNLFLRYQLLPNSELIDLIDISSGNLTTPYYEYNKDTGLISIYTNTFFKFNVQQYPIMPQLFNFDDFQFDYGSYNRIYFPDATTQSNNSITLTTNEINQSTNFGYEFMKCSYIIEPVSTTFLNHIHFELKVDTSYNSIVSLFIVNSDSVPEIIPLTNTASNKIYYSLNSETGSLIVYMKQLYPLFVTQEPVEPTSHIANINNYIYGDHNITYFSNSIAKKANRIDVLSNTPSSVYSLQHFMKYYSIKPVNTNFLKHIQIETSFDISYNSLIELYIKYPNDASLTQIPMNNTRENIMYYDVNYNTGVLTYYTTQLNDIYITQTPINPVPIQFLNYIYGTNNLTYFPDETSKNANTITYTINDITSNPIPFIKSHCTIYPLNTYFSKHIQFDIQLDYSYNSTVVVYYKYTWMTEPSILSDSNTNNDVYYVWNDINGRLTVFMKYVCEIFTSQESIIPIPNHFLNYEYNYNHIYGNNQINKTYFPNLTTKTQNAIDILPISNHYGNHNVKHHYSLLPINTQFDNHIQFVLSTDTSYNSFITVMTRDISSNMTTIPAESTSDNNIYYEWDASAGYITIHTRVFNELFVLQTAYGPTPINIVNYNYGIESITLFPTQEDTIANQIELINYDISSVPTSYNLINLKSHHSIHPLNTYFTNHLSYDIALDPSYNSSIKVYRQWIPETLLKIEHDMDVAVMDASINALNALANLHSMETMLSAAETTLIEMKNTAALALSERETANIDYVSKMSIYDSTVTRLNVTDLREQLATAQNIALYAATKASDASIALQTVNDSAAAAATARNIDAAYWAGNVTDAANAVGRATAKKLAIAAPGPDADAAALELANATTELENVITLAAAAAVLRDADAADWSAKVLAASELAATMQTALDHKNATVSLLQQEVATAEAEILEAHTSMIQAYNILTIKQESETNANAAVIAAELDVFEKQTAKDNLAILAANALAYSNTIQEQDIALHAADDMPVIVPSTNNQSHTIYYVFNTSSIENTVTIYTKVLMDIFITQDIIQPIPILFNNYSMNPNTITYFSNVSNSHTNQIHFVEELPLTASSKYNLLNVKKYCLIEPTDTRFTEHIRFDILIDSSYNSDVYVYKKSTNDNEPSLVLSTSTNQDDTYYDYIISKGLITIHTKQMNELIIVQEPNNPMTKNFINLDLNIDNITVFPDEASADRQLIEYVSHVPNNLYNKNITHVKSHCVLVPLNTYFSKHIRFDMFIDSSYNSFVYVYYRTKSSDAFKLIPESNTSTNEIYYTNDALNGIITIYTMKLVELIIDQQPKKAVYLDFDICNCGDDTITLFPTLMDRLSNQIRLVPQSLESVNSYGLNNIQSHCKLEPLNVSFTNHIYFSVNIDNLYNKQLFLYCKSPLNSNSLPELIPPSNTLIHDTFYLYDGKSDIIIIYTKHTQEFIIVQEAINPNPIGFINYNYNYGLNNLTLFPDEYSKSINNIKITVGNPSKTYGLQNIKLYNKLEPVNTTFSNHIKYNMQLDPSTNSTVSLYYKPTTYTSTVPQLMYDISHINMDVETYYEYKDVSGLVTIYTKRLQDIYLLQENHTPIANNFINYDYGIRNETYFPDYASKITNQISIVSRTQPNSYGLQNIRSYNTLEPANTLLLNHIQFDIQIDYSYNSIVSLYTHANANSSATLVPSSNNSSSIIYYAYNPSTGIITIHTKYFYQLYIIQAPIAPVTIGFTNYVYGSGNITLYKTPETKAANQIRFISNVLTNNYGISNLKSYQILEPLDTQFTKFIRFDLKVDSSYNSLVTVYYKSSSMINPIVLPSTNNASSPASIYYVFTPSTGIIALYTKQLYELLVTQIPVTPSFINWTTHTFNYGLNNITVFPTSATRTANKLTYQEHDPSNNYGLTNIKSYHTLDPIGTTFATHVSYDMIVDASYNSDVLVYYKTASTPSPVLIPFTNTSTNNQYYIWNKTTGAITIYTKLFADMFIVQNPIVAEATTFGDKNLNFGANNMIFYPDEASKEANKIQLSEFTETTAYGLNNVTAHYKLEPANTTFSNHISYDVKLIPTDDISNILVYYKANGETTPSLIPYGNTSNSDIYYLFDQVTGLMTIHTKHFSEFIVLQNPPPPKTVNFTNFNYGTNNLTYYPDHVSKSKNSIYMTTSNNINPYGVPFLQKMCKLEPDGISFLKHVSFDIHVEMPFSEIDKFFVYMHSGTDKKAKAKIISPNNTALDDVYYRKNFDANTITVYTKHFSSIILSYYEFDLYSQAIAAASSSSKTYLKLKPVQVVTNTGACVLQFVEAPTVPKWKVYSDSITKTGLQLRETGSLQLNEYGSYSGSPFGFGKPLRN